MRKQDLTGQTFGRLTVIEEAPKRNGRVMWLCSCSCAEGKQIEVQAKQLTNGRTQSCGCLKLEMLKGRKVDRVGHRYGRLLVIEEGPQNNHGQTQWWCSCDCGGPDSMVLVSGSHLNSGDTTSCGCVWAERMKEVNTTHGKAGTPLYQIWGKIKDRCDNSGCSEHSNYGGRGITMCDGWRKDFTSFEADMGERPSGGHSIDRINGDGHYSCGHCAECLENGWPANCRWATAKQQCRNKSNNRVIEFDGKSQTLTEWAEELGMSGEAISMRLKANWSVEEALTIPQGGKRAGGGRGKRTDGPTLGKAKQALKKAIRDGSVIVPECCHYDGCGKTKIRVYFVNGYEDPLTVQYFCNQHYPGQNTMLTLNGETRPLREWADALGLAVPTLRARLKSSNWTLERALTTPKQSGE